MLSSITKHCLLPKSKSKQSTKIVVLILFMTLLSLFIFVIVFGMNVSQMIRFDYNIKSTLSVKHRFDFTRLGLHIHNHHHLYIGNSNVNNNVDINNDVNNDVNNVSKAMNFPICEQLNELNEQVFREERGRHHYEVLYRRMMQENELNCGYIQQSASSSLISSFMSLFVNSKSSSAIKDDRCIIGIIPAKRRVLNYLTTLCDMQSLAYHHYQSLLSNDRVDDYLRGDNKSTSILAKPSSGAHRLKQGVLSHDVISLATIHSDPNLGIIYTGDYKRLKSIYQSILALRLLNCSLPIEVWVSDHDIEYCQAMLVSRLIRPGYDDRSYRSRTGALSSNSRLQADISSSTFCRVLPDVVGTYSHKFYALLSTSFTDVLYLDADNIPLRNVEELFMSKEYQRFGAVLWPDKCGERCSDGSSSIKGFTAFRNHVLYAANIGRLKFDYNDRRYAQEVESGQLLLNLRQHGPVIELARKLMEDEAFVAKYAHGDKDLWRLAFLMTGQEFYFVPYDIGLSYSVFHQQRDCLVHYFGHDDRNPLFCHQAKVQDKDSLSTIFRAVPDEISKSSVCIQLRSIIRVNTSSLVNVRINTSINSGVVKDHLRKVSKNASDAAGLPTLISRKRNNANDYVYREVKTQDVGKAQSHVSIKIELENTSQVFSSVGSKRSISPKRLRRRLDHSNRGIAVELPGIGNSKKLPIYARPNSLYVDHPPAALEISELLGVVYATVDETWPQIGRKSNFAIALDASYSQFLLWLRKAGWI